MSGHRAERPTGHRGRVWAATGAAAVVMAVSAVAVAFAFRPHPGRSGGAAASSAPTVQSTPMNALGGSERDIVPDACTTLDPHIADSLAPNAQRTAMGQAAQSDVHSECAWSQYGSVRARQLTVELRAITSDDGTTATNVAVRTYHDEWDSDRSGRNLDDGVAVRDSHSVKGVGEDAYVVYTVDGQAQVGAAIANVRLANVLITVNYSGGDDREKHGHPLSDSAATNGALTAAKDILSKLQSQS